MTIPAFCILCNHSLQAMRLIPPSYHMYICKSQSGQYVQFCSARVTSCKCCPLVPLACVQCAIIAMHTKQKLSIRIVLHVAGPRGCKTMMWPG